MATETAGSGSLQHFCCPPLSLPERWGAQSVAMSTAQEIEAAWARLPRAEQQKVLARLAGKLAAGNSAPPTWPVPGPALPREELQRIHALIAEEFSAPGS